MKRNLLSAIILLFAVIACQAQIPNASFENWTGGNPDDWFTANTPFTQFITQVSNAHEGASAARSDALNISVVTLSSPLLLGPLGQGAHTSTAPEAIHGWYILNSVGGDYFFGVAGMIDNMTGTGGGETGHLGASAVYKEFVINMFYTLGTPSGDSLLLDFALANDTSTGVHLGSYFILDDLSFGALVGIDDASTQANGIESISPNPAVGESQIVYSIQSPGRTSLNIYDAAGKLVKVLVDEMQSPGRYKAVTDISDLPSGTYICKLTGGENSSVAKLIVQH